MTGAAAWLRVLLAVGAFVAVAVAASMLVRHVGANLKEMGGRTSRVVGLVGLAANLCVLAVVVLMLVLVDRRPVSDLGLGLSRNDVVVLVSFLALTLLLAAVFLVRLRASGRAEVSHNSRPAGAPPDVLGAALTVAVLAVVAIQEETLFRGYLTVNLLPSGWVVVAFTSVLLFAAVHLLTNLASPAQIASWTVGGGILVMAYLLSGSLWVAVAIHFTIDLTNVVAFGIVGRYSLLRIRPAVSEGWRMRYRLASSALVAVLLLGAYGAHVRAPSSSVVTPGNSVAADGRSS